MLMPYSFYLQLDPANSIGVDKLIEEIRCRSYLPSRDVDMETIFAVDHCFSIRGQGTIMTGTILQGRIKVNDVSNCFEYNSNSI